MTNTPTWPGGCGKVTVEQNFNSTWSTISWDSAGLSDFHGTGKLYTYINGNLVFKWSGNGAPKQQYRYSTRSLVDVYNYGEWSVWTFDSVSTDPSWEIESRTVYRYRDRTEIPTYHFWKWGGWSDWSTDAVYGTDTRQVEETTFYRYRDKIELTTYYFRRWTSWSDYSEDPIMPEDNLEIQTKIQYRYRPR